MMLRASVCSFVLVAAFAVTGCDNPNQSEPEAVAPAQNPVGETASGTPSAGSRNSALGKAKDAAENTKSQVEQRNADLERMMEDDG